MDSFIVAVFDDYGDAEANICGVIGIAQGGPSAEDVVEAVNNDFRDEAEEDDLTIDEFLRRRYDGKVTFVNFDGIVYV